MGAQTPPQCRPKSEDADAKEYFKATWELSELLQYRLLGRGPSGEVSDSTGLNAAEVTQVVSWDRESQQQWVSSRLAVLQESHRFRCP